MLLMPDELEEQKRLEAEKAQAEQAQQAPAAPPMMTAPVAPLTPWERMQDEHGTGGSILRIIGTGLSGGILGDALMPEMTKAGQDQYASELKAYEGQAEAYTMAQALAGIDPENITPGHIALADQFGGSALSDYYTDMYRAQQSGIGGDEAIAGHFKYTPYQWSQLSPEKRRDLTDRYNYEKNGEGAFDYRRSAEGKSPEQLQEQKSAELFGSAEGQQYGDDRKIITGVRGQIQAYDQGLESLGSIKAMLEDPENSAATGWPRIIRDAIKTNTKADGSMDAEMAAGVVDLISQATFGALSQSELDLLKGGLMDPTKSPEYNLGTINSAMKRIENDRELALGAARGAAERYQKWDGQDDYDTLFENDWLYQNVGAGSKIKPIPAFGNNQEVTFQQYVESVSANLGPFDQQPSRDELVKNFAAMRQEAEEAYKEMKRLERENSVAAQQVRATLERPFPTVQQ